MLFSWALFCLAILSYLKGRYCSLLWHTATSVFYWSWNIDSSLQNEHHHGRMFFRHGARHTFSLIANAPSFHRAVHDPRSTPRAFYFNNLRRSNTTERHGVRVGIRDCRARGVPHSASDSSAHFFSKRPQESGLAHASGRPHVLGCGVDRGRSTGRCEKRRAELSCIVRCTGCSLWVLCGIGQSLHGSDRECRTAFAGWIAKRLQCLRSVLLFCFQLHPAFRNILTVISGGHGHERRRRGNEAFSEGPVWGMPRAGKAYRSHAAASDPPTSYRGGGTLSTAAVARWTNIDTGIAL